MFFFKNDFCLVLIVFLCLLFALYTKSEVLTSNFCKKRLLTVLKIIKKVYKYIFTSTKSESYVSVSETLTLSAEAYVGEIVSPTSFTEAYTSFAKDIKKPQNLACFGFQGVIILCMVLDALYVKKNAVVGDFRSFNSFV